VSARHSSLLRVRVLVERLIAALFGRKSQRSRSAPPAPNSADQTVNRNVRLLSWFNFFGDIRMYGPIMVIYFAQVSGSYTAAASLLAVKMLRVSALRHVARSRPGGGVPPALGPGELDVPDRARTGGIAKPPKIRCP
jgi:hypothetical protein